MKVRIFESGKGDCLMLTATDGTNILVDGGWVDPFRSVDRYSASVAPFLGELRDRGDLIDLLCVSHIDQDHIGGVLRMLNDEFAWRVFEYQVAQGLSPDQPENPRPPEVGEIWHNAFHLQISKNRRAITKAIAAAVPESVVQGSELPGHGDNFLAGLGTSMKEAAQLSRRISPRQLGIPLNAAYDGKLIMARPSDQEFTLGDFTVTVLGPTGKQLRDLRKEWDKWLRSEKGKRQRKSVQRAGEDDEQLLANGSLDAFLAQRLGPAIGDRSSVSEENVASIVLMVEDNGAKVLLTGDARDDTIIEQLEDAGLKEKNKGVHVDVLKVQHHGSENNISEDFTKAITADHYLLCGNGMHHNPDIRAVNMIIDSRIGAISKRSQNPETGNRFKLWFSADSRTEDADQAHMRDLEETVRIRQGQSNGKMLSKFLGGRSLEISL